MHANFPLFPLPLVAMPYGRFALQIFEPRYLDLVKTSLAQQQSFGIVMHSENLETVQAQSKSSLQQSSNFEPASSESNMFESNMRDSNRQNLSLQQESIMPIGTAVRIVDFSQQPNGLLGIVCEGLYKFKVHDTHVDEHNLLIANIETLRSEELTSLPEQFSELIIVLQALLEHEYAHSMGYHSHHDEAYWRAHPTELCWCLASLLPLPESIKYRWLVMDDTLDRLVSILDAVHHLQGAS